MLQGVYQDSELRPHTRGPEDLLWTSGQSSHCMKRWSLSTAASAPYNGSCGNAQQPQPYIIYVVLKGLPYHRTFGSACVYIYVYAQLEATWSMVSCNVTLLGFMDLQMELHIGLCNEDPSQKTYQSQKEIVSQGPG